MECGRSDGEGHFRVPLLAGEHLVDFLRMLVVTAPGYGLGWVDVPKAMPSEKVTVHLRKDVAIRGRVISMEGRPLAGVRVSVNQLEEMPNGRLDEYLTFWERDWNKAHSLKTRWLTIPSKQSIIPPAVTDRNGCFQLAGVGSECIVRLKIQGQGIAHAELRIIARSAFDPSVLNNSVRNQTMMMGPAISGQPPILYGPSFEYVASLERIVEGVVREAGSGKPIPGIRIYGSTGYRSESEAITDNQGWYRLEGLPKVKRYHYFSAQPSPDNPWLSSDIQNKEAAEGLQPVRVDFTLGRGVVIQGRVIDRATGKGVTSSIMFDCLPGNKFAGKPGYILARSSYGSFDDGRFRIKVIPGTGVLKAHASGAVNLFLPAQFSAEDRKHITLTEDGDFTTFEGGIGFLPLCNAAKWMNLAPDAGVVEQDLYLERGATVKVRIQDPQGKPLSGVIVSGIDAIPGQHTQDAYVSPDSECVLAALDPDHPRQVIFYHAERRLAASLTVRGNEKEPITVRLAATGTVTGRVRDANGEAIQGAEVEIWAKGPPSPPSLIYLYLALNRNRLSVRTDKEGRFRLEGVAPDGAFDIDVRRRGAYLDLGSRTKQLQVKAGETLDLGDIRINREE
jgi:protocatechuate 3,4-dioxygenase beta subunit